MGEHNGLYRHFERKNASVYTFGCPCHIVHNTASYGAKAYAEAAGFDLGDFLVDIYYYFDNSTKRQASLKDFCDFCDQDYRKILKYGATRWLSRELCVSRVLKQYPSLQSYFASQPELRSDKRLCRLREYFADPKTEIHLMFFQSILPVFSELNKQLQGEEPQIHCLRQGLSDFLQKLLGRCMLATSYKDKDLDDRASMNFENEDLFLSPKDVMIGFTTRTTMQKHNLLPEEEKKLAQDCRKFMTASLQYACKNFPLKDPLLKHAEFLNFHERANQTFDSVQFFISKFPTLEAAMYDEFCAYQALGNDSQLSDLSRIDHIWMYLGKMEGKNGLRFGLLAQVAQYVLVLPHSNAAEERIFSTVEKNKTKYRGSLSNTTTLPSILTCKTNYFNHTHCYMFKPTKSVLQKAKKAATTYNADHSSTSK
ncbi:predicted protein [Nematostella vectensis]|uniref:HAT C-terminal dimerisation domain-containing protein n=1 Tax=Nematostella vectensis TaxID=45351 RepID=A7RPH8_NEMVE|nr:predicted protein [Nematostella vectensis]|eukprot:XP_001638751.1 predicted protein [Nematostella vectensis]